MKGVQGLVTVGKIKTFVSEPGKPLAPEQWAEIIGDNIISAADTAPEPLRTMTLDIAKQIKQLLAHYVVQIRNEQAAYFVKE